MISKKHLLKEVPTGYTLRHVPKARPSEEVVTGKDQKIKGHCGQDSCAFCSEEFLMPTFQPMSQEEMIRMREGLEQLATRETQHFLHQEDCRVISPLPCVDAGAINYDMKGDVSG